MAKNGNPPTYVIKPFKALKGDTFDQVPLDAKFEFFRIEALLRSEKVQAFHQIPGEATNTTKNRVVKGRNGRFTLKPVLGPKLYRNFGIEWSVLRGTHHKYLRPASGTKLGDTYPWIHDKPFIDLKGKDLTLKEFQRHARDGLLIKINPDFQVETTIKAIRPILKKAHEKAIVPRSSLSEIQLSTPENATTIIPMFPKRKLSYKTMESINPATWLDYFKCYDLRKRLTPGQIAVKFYDDAKKLGLVKSGIKRVKYLIKAAEENNWPPPPIKQ